MSAPIVWRWLGRRAYEPTLAQQEACWRARRAGGPDTCLAVEHPPTITLGKRATLSELRVSEDDLARRGIPCVAIERGGYATYHGPGQLVLYPIVALAARGFGVATFVWTLEQIMIELAARFGVSARRDSRGHGVWTARGKLGAVGIRVRDGIGIHGLAVNIALDLDGFDLITPCGVAGLPITSLRLEGTLDVSVTSVLPVAKEIACRLLVAAPVFPSSELPSWRDPHRAAPPPAAELPSEARV
jgi:lipoyl(octanoyl) transferase